MKSPLTTPRIACFVLGLLIAAFGICFIVKGQLGISPVTSLPYFLSLVFSLSFGTFVALQQTVLFLLQILILRKRFQMTAFWQLPTAYVFGLMCDFWMIVFHDLAFESYPARMASLLFGIFVLCIGLCCQFASNVMVTAPEGFLAVMALTFKKKFSQVKVINDVLFCLTTITLSLLCMVDVDVIREGTLISALCVGRGVFYLKPPVFRFLDRFGLVFKEGVMDSKIIG